MFHILKWLFGPWIQKPPTTKISMFCYKYLQFQIKRQTYSFIQRSYKHEMIKR